MMETVRQAILSLDYCVFEDLCETKFKKRNIKRLNAICSLLLKKRFYM